MDPITLELYRHRFAGIAEEMGVTLRRTSYSPNIKERLDFSCALFDGRGRMVAQAAHIPVHLGAMPASVQAALDAFDEWRAGDVVLLNDPYAGGSHLPDITMISPVFAGDAPAAPAFFVASRAHHADVGGMSPGSLPLSTEIYQEGIIIPPVKLYEGGVLNGALLQLVLRNVRTPDERRGDLAAQRAAHGVGERRLLALIEAHGLPEVSAYADHLLAYSERLTRAAIARWPDGDFSFDDVIELPTEMRDEDPEATTATIRVTARIRGDGVTFDFAGTDAAIHGSLNAVPAVTRSACYYVVRALVGQMLGADPQAGDGAAASASASAEMDIPVNSGCFAPVTVTAPPGCLVHALPPAAVAGGNVETSQRITDAVIGALAQAMPDRLPAAGQGTMNNVTMGGKHADAPWAYYETLGGGMGAAPGGDGLGGAHVHMSNTLNTPVEALEMAYPLRLVRYGLRRDSGGRGLHRGGEGVIREYELLGETTVTMLSERRSVAPWGLAGGDAGAPGRNTVIHRDGREEVLPAKFSRRFRPGQRLRIETPGGGGWGSTPPARG